MKTTRGQLFLKEMEVEEAASRKCIERIPESLFGWKPHERSMLMGALTSIVADVPKWITTAIEKGEINFATWEKYTPTTTADMVRYFDENMKKVKEVLKNVSDEDFENMFYLKAGDKELMKDKLDDGVSSMIRHWVHHRGQLTVYMRLNNILVPSIYGPSADDKTF